MPAILLMQPIGPHFAYVSDMMPSVDHLDTAYTSAPVVIGPDDLGYVIRVVAVADSTQVYVAGLLSPLLLNAGQHVEVLTNTSSQIARVKQPKYFLY